MSDPAANPKVCFTVALGREVGQRVAQLLAMGELLGPCWLRATLMWLQLLPNRTLRVVLRVDQKPRQVIGLAGLYRNERTVETFGVERRDCHGKPRK